MIVHRISVRCTKATEEDFEYTLNSQHKFNLSRCILIAHASMLVLVQLDFFVGLCIHNIESIHVRTILIFFI